MATLNNLRKAADKIGATVEDDKAGETHECRVQAPAGCHWHDGVHEFVDVANRPWKPDYADLMSRMALGFEPCTAETCQLWIDGACEWWEDHE